MLYAGEPDNLSWWVRVLPFAAWMIGPAVAPFLIARWQARQWLSVTIFLFLVASSAFSGLVYREAFFGQRRRRQHW
jgi:hypothetical protein